MAKNKSSSARVAQIFDDLDKYRDFCRNFGFSFDERDLYSSKSFVYRQYQRNLVGKPVKDQWGIDYAKYKEEEAKKARA